MCDFCTEKHAVRKTVKHHIWVCVKTLEVKYSKLLKPVESTTPEAPIKKHKPTPPEMLNKY